MTSEEHVEQAEHYLRIVRSNVDAVQGRPSLFELNHRDNDVMLHAAEVHLKLAEAKRTTKVVINAPSHRVSQMEALGG